MFKKLKDVNEIYIDLLTLRCTKARLEKGPKNTVFFEVNDRTEAIISSRGRKEHSETVSPWLAGQLEKFRNSNISEVKIATKEHPLEVFTGDTSLILSIEGKRYLCSIYRDIYPKGWLVPGGCPRSKRELLDPRGLISRERSEEILIADQKGRIYIFDKDGITETMENSMSWQKGGSFSSITPGIIPLMAKELPMRESDAQNMVIRINGKEKRIKNISVMIDAQVASLSACICLEVILPIKFNDLRIFDGEKSPDGKLLNRPIRLTDEKGDCKAMFSQGNNLFIADWITSSMAKKAIIPSE